MKTKLKTSSKPQNQIILENNNFLNSQNYIINSFGKRKILDSYIDNLTFLNSNSILINNSKNFIKNKIKINDFIILTNLYYIRKNHKKSHLLLFLFFMIGFFILFLFLKANLSILLFYLVIGIIYSHLLLKQQIYSNKFYSNFIIGKITNHKYFIYRYK